MKTTKCNHCGCVHSVAQYSYFEFKSEHKGHRLFRINNENNEVFQIVITNGLKKKGRPNMMGVYRISYQSWIGNCGHSIYKKSVKMINKKYWNSELQKLANKLKS